MPEVSYAHKYNHKKLSYQGNSTSVTLRKKVSYGIIQDMTEQELKDGIGDGRIANQVHLFWTKDVINKARRKKLCPTVIRLAWKLYVAAVKDVDLPENNTRNFRLIK